MKQGHLHHRFRIHTRVPALTQSTTRAVHFRIEKPVLEQYNKISLDKSSKYIRIKHKSTIDKVRHQIGLKNSASQGNQQWCKTIGRYMESKEKIQNKRHNQDLTFNFHKLDKTNRYIYIKRIADQAIPTSIITLNKNNLPPVRSDPDNISKSFAFKSSQTQQKQPEQGKAGKSIRKDSEQLSHTRTYTDIQEHIMSNFISNYFKNKYKQNKKHEPENYLTHSLERYNTD